ncbi:cytochrome b5 [Phlegmacium glaucopus]|nr:cytochrome b5 [Phlegmacium glaucopus]
MTSYLRDWLFGGAVPSDSLLSVPTVELISPPASDDEDGEETETERDNDSPPAFPALNSAQRLQSSNSPRVLTDSQLMPPPPLPSLSARQPGVPLSSSQSSASTLAVPLSTTKAPVKSSKKREKVALAPGHSSLDWAALKTSGQDLRGVDTLIRVPPSMLKQHNKRDDAWTAINGKVYNITEYLPFHPGGEKELMRVAGRDGTKLFATTHGWVNVDFMLDACLVGFFVREPSS